MFWLEQYEIKGTYDPIDVAPEDLPAFINRVRAGEFGGGNITIPLKEQVGALCDTIDEAATSIGAINTIVQTEGRISATNTDHYGFLANLDQHAPGWSARAAGTLHAVVLGAGGASRAIIYALQQRGYDRITLLNRSVDRAETLAREFGAPIDPGPLNEFSRHAQGANLLVNTSSIGMHGSAFERLDLSVLAEDAIVTDLVYTPIMTPLLLEARARGLKTVDGLGMLLHQAVPGFEQWFGVRPEVTAELRQRIEQDL